MAEIHIFTSLVVPVTTNGPSSAALQWSEDGQAFIVTRGAVYILTPSTGINFDTSSVITASVAQSTYKNVKGEALSWYRNMIELEKSTVHYWPLECEDWGAVSLGSLDTSWSSLTLSPTNISQWSSCIFAALNTNLEVSLWAPSKNYLTGEWYKVQDLTQAIKDFETFAITPVQRTLNAQVQCIRWSRQIDLGEGNPHIDGSLLALGNRAGHVIFMRLSRNGVTPLLRQVASLDVGDDWVTHLAWSPWSETEKGCFRASLACAVADGGIVIILVSFFLKNGQQEQGGRPPHHFSLADDGRSCCPTDGSASTALAWIHTAVYAPILVYHKPGVVYLQRMPSELPLGWHGNCRLTLQLQPASTSSTPLAAVSGLLYYAQHDAILVTLFDGSCHLVHGISTAPSLDPSHKGLASDVLTSQVRTVFAIAEGKASFADANHTTGVFSYDNVGCIGWLHEKSRPDDFSYKHDAKHESMFIITRLWSDENIILEQLASQLLNVRDLDAAPSHLLRGAFLYLREKAFVETHENMILGLLRQTEFSSETTCQRHTAPSMCGLDFRHCVATTLFRRGGIRSCRLKLAVAMICSKTQGTTSPFGNLVTELSKSILYFQLRAVLGHFESSLDQLQDSDRSFVHRWIMHCLVQGSSHIRQEAAALADRVGISPDSLLESPGVQEQCPACHAVIPLGVGSTAICPNGHNWARCSVTAFILATPFVRTCVGCCRKALLPPSQRPPSEIDSPSWLPPAANSWLAQELLEAARWCTICGNRFVRVL